MPILTNPRPEFHLLNTSNNQEKMSPNYEISKIAETPELIRNVLHLIKQETNLGVQEINVFLENGKLVLTGFCRSFYTKQRAQAAVLKIIDDIDVVNRIYVA
ncbi:MAG: BON domain-containing protein [Planctomycetaceae bacterium]|jgi:osmotically-inducible protein OsmY|nr:BON domain-containing protein [Planctomycetaceae bacterium]